MNGSEDAGVVNHPPFPYAAGMDSAADRPRNARPEHPRPATGRLLPPEPQELQDWRDALNHPAMLVALRLARVVVRGVALFAVSFVEIMAELLAPIVLIAGIGWSLLPGVLSMAGTEGQAHELLNNVVQSVPRESAYRPPAADAGHADRRRAAADRRGGAVPHGADHHQHRDIVQHRLDRPPATENG